MSERNMTEVEVDGFKYTVSTAAKGHVYEVLAAYESSKEALPILTVLPERPLVLAPEKKPIFGKKDKKKK